MLKSTSIRAAGIVGAVLVAGGAAVAAAAPANAAAIRPADEYTCTYTVTAASLDQYKSDSTGSGVVQVLKKGAGAISAPYDATSNMVDVSSNGKTGWVLLSGVKLDACKTLT
jgi:hypothetical protein